MRSFLASTGKLALLALWSFSKGGSAAEGATLYAIRIPALSFVEWVEGMQYEKVIPRLTCEITKFISPGPILNYTF